MVLKYASIKKGSWNVLQRGVYSTLVKKAKKYMHFFIILWHPAYWTDY